MKNTNRRQETINLFTAITIDEKSFLTRRSGSINGGEKFEIEIFLSLKRISESVYSTQFSKQVKANLGSEYYEINNSIVLPIHIYRKSNEDWSKGILKYTLKKAKVKQFYYIERKSHIDVEDDERTTIYYSLLQIEESILKNNFLGYTRKELSARIRVQDDGILYIFEIFNEYDLPF